MNAIILIGGFGTRLRPLTLTKPKALLPILNRPFLSYQFDLLKEGGVRNVMLACGEQNRPWKKNFAALAPRGLKVHFAFEPKPLGTGGAIRFAYDHFSKSMQLDRSPVLVFNGDVFFDLSVQKFLRFHKNKKSLATVALTKVEDPSRFGLVERDGGGAVIRFLEKSPPPFKTNFINAGAYLLDKKGIEMIPSGRVVSVERDTFPSFLYRGLPVFGFPMSGYWNDIGTHASFLAAHRELLLTKNRWTRGQFFRKRSRLKSTPQVRGRAFFGENLTMKKNVFLDGFVSIGDNVSIGANSHIANSVVMESCTLEEGVELNGAILGKGCRVGKHAIIREGSVLADKSIVHPYTRC